MRDGLWRAAVVVLLSVLFLGGMVHYGAAAPHHEQTRESVSKLHSPAAHAGEQVYFWATVERVGEDPTLRVEQSLRLSLDGSLAADPGDSVQVLGTVNADGSVTAQRLVVSPDPALTRLYAVSGVALALVVLGFFRHWRVQGLAFVPRDGGTGGDGDA